MPEAPAIDDGRRPTFLSSLFRKVTQPQPQPVVTEIEEEPEPTLLLRDSLVEFQAALPADMDIARESFSHYAYSGLHPAGVCPSSVNRMFNDANYRAWGVRQTQRPVWEKLRRTFYLKG